MNQKVLLGVALFVVAVLGVVFPIGGKTIVERVIEPLGAFPGGEILTPVEFRDSVTISPRVNATTTTGTAATLVANDLLGVDFHRVTFGGAQDADFTYTLPASTSLTNLVPRVGATRTVCWFSVASSTSTGYDLIFAGGTGTNLKASTTTIPVPLGVGETDTACFEFSRQATEGGLPGDIDARALFYDDID